MLQPESAGLIIAFHKNDACMVHLVNGKCFREKSDSHLPLEQDRTAVLENGCDSFHPCEGHRSLPRAAGVVPRAEARHDLRRWNANRIEAKDLELGIQPLYLKSNRRLATA